MKESHHRICAHESMNNEEKQKKYARASHSPKILVESCGSYIQRIWITESVFDCGLRSQLFDHLRMCDGAHKRNRFSKRHSHQHAYRHVLRSSVIREKEKKGEQKNANNHRKENHFGTTEIVTRIMNNAICYFACCCCYSVAWLTPIYQQMRKRARDFSFSTLFTYLLPVCFALAPSLFIITHNHHSSFPPLACHCCSFVGVINCAVWAQQQTQQQQQKEERKKSQVKHKRGSEK